MRSLVLANALRQNGTDVRFVCRQLPDHANVLLNALSCDLIELPTFSGESDACDGARVDADARNTAEALADQQWDWLVVDHYSLDYRWESRLRSAADHVMVIDDLADRSHDCDVLLDQNYYADGHTRYVGRVPSHCECLLGPRFALLRDEFRQWHDRVAARTGPVSRVLVSFGGVDATNYTGTAIEALADLRTDGMSVDVVIGMDHPLRPDVELKCAVQGFRCHVQTHKMAELMAHADLAIGAGGITTWERCCLGLPALALTAATNQIRQLHDAAADGLVYSPDVSGERTPVSVLRLHLAALMENRGLRRAISTRGLATVDGRGAVRVLRHLGIPAIDIRPAEARDSAAVFAWRNNPLVREASRNHDEVDWSHHEQWFLSMLSDPDRIMLIGKCDETPVGVVRFDITHDEAEVSIFLTPGAHRPGTGSQLLTAAERWLSGVRPEIHVCRAEVLGLNKPSHGLFAAAGYRVASTWYVKSMARA
jgi:UDP-2,4-diacetamido-2,4,6-trideoxy-beta-L-altropyranose hydrolase